MSVWDKYTKLEKSNNNQSNINTYKAKKDFLIKEVEFKNEEEKLINLGAIEQIKNEIRVYETILDINYIYVAIDSDEKSSEKFEQILKLSKTGFKNESIIKSNGKYSNFSEIQKIYEKGGNKMVKFELKNNGKTYRGTGFFLELDEKYGLPFKKGLFTCNHVLNEEFLTTHDDIDFKFKNKNISLNIEKNLEILTINDFKENSNKQKRRRIFTESSFFDFTCIEIFDKEFKDVGFFKLSKNINNINNDGKDICALHYPLGEELSFSLGHIIKRIDSLILHTASTVEGSSGSPVLLREDLSVVALHFGGYDNSNISTNMEDILLHMKYTYLNMKNIKIFKNKLIEDFSIKSSCYKYIKNQILIHGKLGFIYAGINKDNKDKLTIVEINLIKYFEMCNDDFNEFSKKIIEMIENIKKINKRELIDIYIECNCLNFVIGKYEEKFNQYYENHELSDDEINNILLQLNIQIQIFNFFNIKPGNISPEKIIIGEKEENQIKFKFLLYYDKIIQVEENKDFLSQSKDSGPFLSIGILIYYLLMKYNYNYKKSIDTLILKINNAPYKNKTKDELCYDVLKKNLEEKKYYKSLETLCKVKKSSNFFLTEKEINDYKNILSTICIYSSDNEGKNIFYTGFFCKIKYKDFPFTKALIIPDKRQDLKGEINLMYIKEESLQRKTLYINQKNRKIMFCSVLHCNIYCIELFESDGIEDFLLIDEDLFKEDYINKDIVLLQYNGSDHIFNFSKGAIKGKDENGRLIHSAETSFGAQGSPIILREKFNYLVGIHLGYESESTHKKKKIGLYLHDIFIEMKEKK